MRKIAIITALMTSVFMAPTMASGQMLNPMEFREAKTMLDRVFSNLPDKIECTNFVELQRNNPRDMSTTQATVQKHVFHLTNANLKLSGGYVLSDKDTSTVIYSLSSGGSDMNIIVGVDMFEAKVLAVAPPLPQPNTCQAGMQLVRM
jgi:hypothetical protein